MLQVGSQGATKRKVMSESSGIEGVGTASREDTVPGGYPTYLVVLVAGRSRSMSLSGSASP